MVVLQVHNIYLYVVDVCIHLQALLPLCSKDIEGKWEILGGERFLGEVGWSLLVSLRLQENEGSFVIYEKIFNYNLWREETDIGKIEKIV